MTNSDEGEEFYESLDRVLSSSCSSTSASDDDDESIHSEHHFRYSHCSPPSADSSDVWLSEPGSVVERRRHLFHQMGLSGDLTLAPAKPERDEASYDDLLPRSNLTRVTSITGAFARSRSDGSVEPRIFRRQHASVSGKPPLVGRSRPSLGGEVELEVLEGDDRRIWEDARMCTIKDLGNGTEFVVKEFGEDGLWKNLRDVGSGRQLSMEEFDICVGSSPAVQELMRRPDVEESGNGSGVSSDRSKDGGESYGGGMSKRRSSWLKSLKNVVSVGHWQDWRSSEEKDTSSEKGERRSSSATDDSQEAQDAVQSILHGPELVKVRQYGKSHKELTGLFLSQEIQAHNGSIWTIKFSLDSCYLASAGEDFVVHVWQVYEQDRTPEILVDRAGEEDDNGNILPEEMLLISSMEGSHWEKKKGSNGSNGRKSVSLDHVMTPEHVFTIAERPIYSFTGHVDDVLDLSWSTSQYLLSSSMDKTVRLWHLSSTSCLKIFSHSDYVTCVQFNPIDDRYFISGSLDAKVRLWSIPEGRVVDWNDLHEIVTAACYTPDGQGALVGSNEGHCYLFDTSENMLLQKSQVELHSKKQRSIHKKITGFQFTPGCSREVLITSADSRIRVMDGSNLIQKFKGFRNTSSQISAFPTANGKYVICASEDSRVYVWRYDAGTRPSRSKTAANVCQSYEYFHSMGVTTAVPWPSSGSTKCKLDDSNNNSDRSAWGMAIVTAGGGGALTMALQTSSFLSSALSNHKLGKVNCGLNDSAFLGVHFSDHRIRSTSGPLLLPRKRLNVLTGIRAQTTATASPAINRSTQEAKKTLRKGNVVITGASSGLGLATAKVLAESGKWHVIMACRDFLKAEKAAKSAGMAKENYSIMHLDLASLNSVRQFVKNFRQVGVPLDTLVCNAAVYFPTASEPTYTADGFEMSVGVNHLGHFLLARELLEDMKQSDYPSQRLIIVGSITGNTNTLAGNIPPKANLGDLRGLAGGLNETTGSSMIDGGKFDGAKAYKDSKVCNMLMMQEFHRRYHEETGITFSSLYPGCIATTGLFREHIGLFRTLFPPFQKYITKGYVSEEEAGNRLAQVVSDPSLTKSGVYWSWNKNSASFENELSQEASDAEKAKKVWDMTEKLLGLA